MSQSTLDHEFLDDAFDSESFIQTYRNQTTLENVAEILEEYVEKLNGELFSIINDDYSSFLELSQMLVHIDSQVADLRMPLTDIQSKVANLEQLLSEPIAQQQELKTSLESIRYKRHLLELSLNIWDTVESLDPDASPPMSSTRDDILLLPTDTDAGQFGGATEQGLDGNGDDDVDADDEEAENNRFLGIERKAQAFARLPFIVAKDSELPLLQAARKTISKLEESLVDEIKVEFGVEITPDRVFAGKERIVNRTSLARCLRSYALLGRVSEAEAVFQELSAVPFLNRLCTVGNLDGKVRNSCSGLPNIYRGILEFVVKECRVLTELVNDPDEGLNMFDFVGNGVACATVDVMTTKLPQIFTSGSATTLHSSFLTTCAFFDILASIAQNPENVARCKRDMLSNWNLAVFSQLCAQDFIDRLNTELEKPVPNSFSQVADGGCHLFHTTTLKSLVTQCWSDEKWLPGLSSDLFKLSMQLVVRYTRWATHGVQVFKNTFSADTATTVPDPLAEKAWQESSVLSLLVLSSDMASLGAFVVAAESSVRAFLEKDQLGNVEALKGALQMCSEQCNHVSTLLKNSTIDFVVQRCTSELSAVAAIPESFYFRGKPVPTAPSAFVDHTLAPLEELLKGHEDLIAPGSSEYSSFVELVIARVAEEFQANLQKTWTGVERKIETLKKVNKNIDDRLDEMNKIRAQLKLDIERFCSIAEGLGHTVNQASLMGVMTPGL